MHNPAHSFQNPREPAQGPGPAQAEADAIQARAAQWASSVRPNNPFEVFLLTRIAADAVRIERSDDHEAELRALAANRARYYWDNDRRIAVEELGDTLARRPAIVARKLRGSLYGCEWLLLRWKALAAPLRLGRDWSDDQKARALDLLGVAHDLRDGPTPLDGGPGDRLGLAEAKVAELAAVATADGALALLNAEEYRLVAKGVAVFKDPAIEGVRLEATRARRRLEWAWNRIRGGRADLRASSRPAPAPRPPLDDQPDPEPDSDEAAEPEAEFDPGAPSYSDDAADRMRRAIDRMLAVPVPPRTARSGRRPAKDRVG